MVALLVQGVSPLHASGNAASSSRVPAGLAASVAHVAAQPVRVSATPLPVHVRLQTAHALPQVRVPFKRLVQPAAPLPTLVRPEVIVPATHALPIQVLRVPLPGAIVPRVQRPAAPAPTVAVGRARGFALPPPQVAGDGTYSGEISGFDARTVYLWQHSVLLALPLGPSSVITLAGKRVSVWALDNDDTAQAQVHGHLVTQLAAALPPAAPGLAPTPPTHALVQHAQIQALSQPDSPQTSDSWAQTNASIMGPNTLTVDPANSNHLWVGSNFSLYEGLRSGAQIAWTSRPHASTSLTVSFRSCSVAAG